MKHQALAFIIMLTLAGCTTVGPYYQRPDLGLSQDDAFVSATAPAALPGDADLRWWQRFDDPLMAQWVERALAGNLDVAVAFERVEQAQALLRAARASRSLGVAGQAVTAYRHSPGNAIRQSGQGSQNTGGASASAGLNFDWNADLWGGLRQAERSAAASVLRSQDLVQAAQLATAGLAARGYIGWREAQQEHALLRESLHVREETLRIVRIRVDAGLSSHFDLSRAQADLAAVQAEMDDAAGRILQAELALQIVTGQRPTAQTSAAMSAQSHPIPQLDGAPPVPRPIDLLRLRPDVRAAERALIAAFADIGVAQASLYPQLRLPGELLLAVSGLGTGTIVRTLTAGLSALLQVPLLDGGQRAAELDGARSRAREAALVYRKSVLESLEQVEAALIANQTIGAQRNARRAAVDASQAALRQARTLYTEGLSGFLEVLDVQRTLLANRLILMRSEADAARAAVAIFEATGLIHGMDTAHAN